MSRSSGAFAALVAVVVAASGSYLAMARRSVAPRTPMPTVLTGAAATRVATIRARDHLVFRDLAPGRSYGMLAVAALDDLAATRTATTLACSRVYSRAATTACLALDPDPQHAFPLYLLDEHLAVLHRYESPGAPSRIRVSPDGAFVGFTAFTARDSYQAFGFSTRSRLLNARTGSLIADLESFEVSRDGQPFHAVDFNFWGVTFAAGSREFYATLATAGHDYLLKGRTDAKTLEVIRDGIECPSLSPDGQRIAFKRRLAPAQWEAAVYDFETRSEVHLPGTSGLDDQLEWLDAGTLLYGLREARALPKRASIWQVAADGRTPPTLFLADAESPSVVRR